MQNGQSVVGSTSQVLNARRRIRRAEMCALKAVLRHAIMTGMPRLLDPGMTFYILDPQGAARHGNIISSWRISHGQSGVKKKKK